MKTFYLFLIVILAILALLTGLRIATEVMDSQVIWWNGK